MDPAQHSSNLGFNIGVFYKGEIFNQWEAMFPLIARHMC
jgi:hypothetical protein